MPNKTLTVIACAAAVSLTAVSCVENDRSLGGGLLPDESVISLNTKTFDNIPVANRTCDSVQAANSIKMMVGTMNDPVFGTVESSAAAQIIPYSDSTDFGDNATLRSAYINLSIDSTYCLEEDQKGIHQRIKIYRLLTPIDSSMSFCNSITQEDYSDETVTVSDPVIYGEGEIRIELKTDFAQELLNTPPEEFEDFSLFIKRIPGLFLKIEPSLNLSGGRMNYLNLGNSTINLNYRITDPVRGEVDTTESFSFGYSSYKAYNYFKTGSESLSCDTPGDILYIESLSGIKPHIAAADLKNMIDTWIKEEGLEEQTVIVSRAELKFPYPEPDDYERFNLEHPAYIYAFTRSAGSNDSLRYYQPLSYIYNTSNYGSINRSLMEYSMDITPYIQELINSDASDINGTMDLWIAPMKYRVNILDERVYEFDNYNYNKTILNGPSADRKPTLSITYGVLQ